jgi:hypothetical protein
MSPGTAGSNGRTSGGWSKAPSGLCEHLQLVDGFKKSLSMSGEVGSLAGDRVVRMSDPERLTSHDDKAYGRDTRGLILRIIVVAVLGVVFWQTIIAAGRL